MRNERISGKSFVENPNRKHRKRNKIKQRNNQFMQIKKSGKKMAQTK